jgi:dTDP-4-dehydrorhamnose reductase
MKLFLTGASGLLGHALAVSFLKMGWEVHASSHQHPPLANGLRLHKVDLLNKDALREWLSQTRQNAIVNAAGLSVSETCDENPPLSQALNVELPCDLARIAGEQGLRFIHFSTDMVFDGKSGNYSTSSPTQPSNRYGQHKLESEKQVRGLYKQSCVIRLPLLMGNSPSGTRSVHESLWRKWKESISTALFQDEWRQPVSASNVADLTAELLQKESISGLFHWAGADKVNRWEMGLLIAEKLGVPEHLLQKTVARNFSQFRNRPLDLSMDSSKLKAQVQTEPAPFKIQLAEIVIPGR